MSRPLLRRRQLPSPLMPRVRAFEFHIFLFKLLVAAISSTDGSRNDNSETLEMRLGRAEPQRLGVSNRKRRGCSCFG